MKKAVNKLWAVLLLFSLILSGCGLSQGEKEECPYEEYIVVDVFDGLSNYQGIQSGWFAKIVKDKFNMELNIIAPNVAGGGDTLFETRSAAGNLGDLIICSGENGMLQRMVTAGLLLDMEPYIKNDEIMRFETAIRKLNQDITPEGIYGIPSELSENAPTVPSESLEPVYGPYIRWDLYKQLGYPEIKTLEDLLPVLKQMQELEPRAENGEKTYAFSFFKDWDGNLMNAAKQPCCFYGYDENGFVLVKADSSDYQSIIDEDSLYIRMLKWYFDANQMGLVDPESSTQNFESLIKKYEDGQILYSPWPWVAQTYYNSMSNKQRGKGFMMADIEDMNIYSYGCSPDGNHKTIMAIGSNAQDPERIADFIDWLYSPEGISANGVTSMADTAGPEGLSWEYGENGPYLTEFGIKALLEGDAKVPEEWGSGGWRDGISELNYMPVSKSEVDDKGYPYQYLLWDSVMEMEETALDKDWKELMNADTTLGYLIENNKLIVSPGCGYTAPPESSEETAIRKQCRTVIQKYSWEMIFAENEEEFYSLFDKMQEEVLSLGYEKILAFDMRNAVAKEQARQDSVNEYGGN
ncbi:MAG: extracellular solute-binding protein [Lachnospiraceae bacterium]|nr:extracellular solute-binding protein [Lachnospiraceae bacterium]